MQRKSWKELLQNFYRVYRGYYFASLFFFFIFFPLFNIISLYYLPKFLFLIVWKSIYSMFFPNPPSPD